MLLSEKEIIEKYGKDEVCRNCTSWDEKGFCEHGNGQTIGIQQACESFINKHIIKN